MSLSIDGVWKAGVWATTVWGEGVWREGAATTTAVKTGTGGIDPAGGKRKTIFKPTGLDYRERKARAIVEQVAKRQVEQPTLDEFQQTEELLREFQAEGIALENRYLMALAAERDRLITQEIATLVRLAQQSEEEMAIILLAASE